MSRSFQWSLPFWLSHQNPTRIPILPIRATHPTHHMLLGFTILIIFDEDYKFTFFTILLLFHPSSVQTFSSTLSVYVLLLTSETNFHIHAELQTKL
jgi:hypothetical protein